MSKVNSGAWLTAEGPAQAARSLACRALRFLLPRIAETLSEGIRGFYPLPTMCSPTSQHHGFVAAIRRILKDDGVAVIEAPYIEPLIEHCEFDTITRDICYFRYCAR